MVESDGSHKNDLTVCVKYTVSDVGLCMKNKFHVDLNKILIRPITK